MVLSWSTQEILLSTREDHLRLSSGNERSFSNDIKAVVEKYNKQEWDTKKSEFDAQF
jgi:hypothetical protein